MRDKGFLNEADMAAGAPREDGCKRVSAAPAPFFFLAKALFSLASCKDEDDGNGDGALAGVWRVLLREREDGVLVVERGRLRIGSEKIGKLGT